MNCSNSDQCYNKNICCNHCTRREGYEESYDWFLDKVNYVDKLLNPSLANESTKKVEK